MILGVGTDIVEVARISRLMDGGNERFLRRMLHEHEYTRFQGLPENLMANWLAKRFAAKEACAKALGTGIGKQAQLTEIETRHNARGQPALYLHGVTQTTARQLGVTRMDLSLADERCYALAFVVLSGE